MGDSTFGRGIDASRWVCIVSEEVAFRARYGVSGTERPDLVGLATQVVGRANLRRVARWRIDADGDSYREEGRWVIRVADDVLLEARVREVLAHEIAHVWFGQRWAAQGLRVPDPVYEACAETFGRALRMPRRALRHAEDAGWSQAMVAVWLGVSVFDLRRRSEDLRRARAARASADEDSAPP